MSYAAIGLDNPKSPVNVGSVMRAAGCYGASMVATRGYRAACRPGYTDTIKQWLHIPLLNVDDLHTAIPYNCIPIAVDLVPEAVSLFDYQHPDRAFYVFGAEDATLGKRILSWCRDVIYVPTNHCMNLAATVNVVLYDRASKEKCLT